MPTVVELLLAASGVRRTRDYALSTGLTQQFFFVFWKAGRELLEKERRREGGREVGEKGRRETAERGNDKGGR